MPKHLVLVTSSLSGGGAERILVTMAETWAAEGHRITVVTLRRDETREYVLPGAVNIVRLKIISEKNSFWDFSHVLRLLRLRRGLLRLRPDLVFSFLDKLNTAVVLALSGTNTPVVATEHLAPWMNPLGFAWETLRKIAYFQAVAVVSPTEAITAWFNGHMKGNFVTIASPTRSLCAPQVLHRRRVILGVGRLADQKGFDLLIDAFSRIAGRFPEWTIEIAGEGAERVRLELLIDERSLRNRIKLLGHVLKIEDLYYEAEVFALPSRHEAYPMALCEAASAGCCLVSADCPTGPKEIFKKLDGAGVLVPVGDVHGFANALAKVLDDTELRENLAARAAQNAFRLSAMVVIKDWDQLLTNLEK